MLIIRGLIVLLVASLLLLIQIRAERNDGDYPDWFNATDYILQFEFIRSPADPKAFSVTEYGLIGSPSAYHVDAFQGFTRAHFIYVENSHTIYFTGDDERCMIEKNPPIMPLKVEFAKMNQVPLKNMKREETVIRTMPVISYKFELSDSSYEVFVIDSSKFPVSADVANLPVAVTIKTGPVTNFYNIYGAKRNAGLKSEKFAPPPGMYCLNPTEQQEVPLPPILKFREVITKKNLPEPYQELDVLNNALLMVSKQVQRKNIPYMQFNADGELTLIQDYRLGTSYYVNTSSGRCMFAPYRPDNGSDLVEPDARDDAILSIRSVPHALTQQLTYLSSFGEVVVRGVPTTRYNGLITLANLEESPMRDPFVMDLFVHKRADIRQNKPMKINFQLYSSLTIGDFGSYYESHELLDVRAIDFKKLQNIEEVWPAEITNCYTVESDVMYVQAVLTPKLFLNATAEQIVKAAEQFPAQIVYDMYNLLNMKLNDTLRPLRLQKISVTADQANVMLDFVVLPPTPLEGLYHVSAAFHMPMVTVANSVQLNTNAILQDCMRVCKNYAVFDCASASFDFVNRTCYLSPMRFDPDVLVYNTNFTHVQRTVSDYPREVDSEQLLTTMDEMMAQGSFNLRSTVYLEDGPRVVLFKVSSIERGSAQKLNTPLREVKLSASPNEMFLQRFVLKYRQVAMPDVALQSMGRQSAENCARRCYLMRDIMNCTFFQHNTETDECRIGTIDLSRTRSSIAEDSYIFDPKLSFESVVASQTSVELSEAYAAADSIRNCARQCLVDNSSTENPVLGGETNFCRGFFTCPYEPCVLLMMNNTEPPSPEPHCLHFERSFDLDFTFTGTESECSVTPYATFANSSPNECARLCVAEPHRKCHGFLVVDNLKICALIQDYQTGTEGRGGNKTQSCDRYNRMYNVDGSEYQFIGMEKVIDTKQSSGMQPAGTVFLCLFLLLLGFVIAAGVAIYMFPDLRDRAKLMKDQFKYRRHVRV